MGETKKSNPEIIRMRVRDLMNGVGKSIDSQIETGKTEMTASEWKKAKAMLVAMMTYWVEYNNKARFSAKMTTVNAKVTTDLQTMIDSMVELCMTPAELKAHNAAIKAKARLEKATNALMAKVESGELSVADALKQLKL